MKSPHVKLIPQSPLRLGFLLIPLVLGCFALSPTARAVTSAPDGCGPDQYIITPGTDQIVRGTLDIGNHTDDGDTFISLPFPFALYGHTYNSVNVSSNGRLDFVCANEPPLRYNTACLPAPANQCPYAQTIFGVWQDMRTDFGLSGCSGFPGGNCGIFTSVTGSAPERIFNIEWRTVLFADARVSENFEVRLYENSALNRRFDVIIGTLEQRSCPHVCIIQGPWVSGVQGLNSVFTQDFCIADFGTLPQNVSHTYTIQPCIEVEVDIKPGTFPNIINPRSKGVIPVAILTTDTFDATTVDETTVRFGPNGTEAAPVQSALEDVDGDGDTDMILHFKTQDTGIVCGDTSASLTGETFGGQAIEGSDSIKTVGCN